MPSGALCFKATVAELRKTTQTKGNSDAIDNRPIDAVRDEKSIRSEWKQKNVSESDAI